MDSQKHVDPVNEGSSTTLSTSLKINKAGIVLTPQPTDDPKDPLNWRQSKKILVLATISLAAFAGIGTPFVHRIALAPQAETYHKTTTQIAWSTSAAIAGQATGPILLAPWSHKYGRSSLIFWGIFLCMIFNIWGATMTKPTQFVPFIISRLFAGLAGGLPAVFGVRVIFDIFFAHERGRAFSVFHITFLLGIVGIPTLGAFTSVSLPWPVMFWWSVGLLGFTLIMCFLFLEESGFDREGVGKYPVPPDPFISNRVATFLLGSRVQPPTTFAETARITILPFIIGVTPSVMIIGLVSLTTGGFDVMLQILQTVFIQEPVMMHGYGMTLQENAFFSFTYWLALMAAQIYGYLFNDRLPLWICRHRGGVWRPEYRLHVLWLPAVLMSLGLGLFGACLRYHYSPVLLAFAAFLVSTGAYISVPLCVTYAVECCTRYPAEATIAVNFYRLSFGLTTSYFIDPWVAAVGVQWAFGMSAFFVVGTFLLVALLVFFGERIREIQFAGILSSESGTKLVDVDSNEKV